MKHPGDLLLKDPQSIEPFGFDWTAYLAEIDAAELVSISTWAVIDPAITLSGSSIATGGKKTLVRASGGVVGKIYTLTNHITTSSGVEDERSLQLLVQQR